MGYKITDLLIENKTVTDDFIDGYCLVVDDPAVDHGVKAATDGSQYIIGVQSCPVSKGGCVDVMTMGIHGVRLAGPVVAGDPITATTDGKGIKGITGEYIVGYAVTAGAPGQIISVRIIGQHL